VLTFWRSARGSDARRLIVNHQAASQPSSSPLQKDEGNPSGALLRLKSNFICVPLAEALPDQLQSQSVLLCVTFSSLYRMKEGLSKISIRCRWLTVKLIVQKKSTPTTISKSACIHTPNAANRVPWYPSAVQMQHCYQ
jgi:hypothetical protein